MQIRKPRPSLQLGPLDCGPANLRGLCLSMGLRVDNARIRSLCGTNNSGTSLLGLFEAATKLGFDVDLKPLDLFDLRENQDEYLPAIVAIDGGGPILHYVTIHSIKGMTAKVMDPASGMITMGFDELWRKMKRYPVPVQAEQIVEEEQNPENAADVIQQLGHLGISRTEAEKWVKNNSLFFIDDCLKYAQALRAERIADSYGGSATLLRELVVRKSYRLPKEFRTSIVLDETASIATLNSPLALVFRGGDVAVEHGRGDSPRRRLLQLLWRYRRAWRSVAVLGVCGSLLNATIPLVSGLLIESLDTSWPPLILILVAIGVATLFAQYISASNTLLTARLSQAMIIKAKAGLLFRYQHMPEWFANDRQPGEQMTRVDESAGLAIFIIRWGGNLAAHVVALVLAVYLLVHTWWPMLAISAGALLLRAGINEYFARRLQRLNRDVLEAGAAYNTRFIEILRGLEEIRLIQANHRSFFEADGFAARSICAVYRLQDWRLIQNLAGGLTGAIMMVALSIVAFLGLSEGTVQPSAIVTAFMLSEMARAALSDLLSFRKDLESHTVVFERYEAYLDVADARPQAPRPAATCDAGATAPALELEDVVFAYGNQDPVLKGVDLRVEAGEHTCVIGSSGQGKSTLFDVAAGLLQPSRGRVFAAGGSCGEDSDLRICLVEQVPSLLDATIRENLVMGRRDLDEDALRRAAATALLTPVIEGHPDGLDRHVGGRGTRLSGGEARRLCLARALLRQPRVVLMDETLSAIDWMQRKEVLGSIREQDPNLAVLICSHDPTDAFLCDRVMILEGGVIVEVGSADQLAQTRTSRFHDLVESAGWAS